jgi:putative heme-binding domain-containing protein
MTRCLLIGIALCLPWLIQADAQQSTPKPGDAPQGYLLKPVANPPLVQMLVPGFTVRELPVQIPNINNVRYRHDGKLVALGYNGHVYLLSDKDGDGLEETVETFWDNKTGLRGPLGILLTPPKYDKGQGLFVASKGKVSLIVDTDSDDRADKEIIVAQGWKEIAQAVDALGVAMDKDGNLYFGLGTANYANAYLKTKDGKAEFDIKSERGTIQRVSPDFKKRETVCTGIRFPVGLAFNRHGDLFCTDQEGATWLPNGNPFDELLHIQPGRHYGFPPRHPKILPNVIDEPSVFDYGPQHQSTCGLFFNESVNGGPTFGPANWAGDAIVCGESRGKLYRTKLVKTPSGYVAQNHIISVLQMLTVDACVSPKGDLVVCCHSGPPDWGTGPQGKGKLFKISYIDKNVPQPLFAYAAAPREVRIAFDKPLSLDYLKSLSQKVKIEYGPYVQPGDRFETLAPPYAIVKQQLATPRHQLSVHSVQVTGDRRTLVLTTAEHRDSVRYAVMLPDPSRAETVKRGEIARQATIGVGYDLTGVHAEWLGKDGQKWSGWLPHLDLEVAKGLTVDSAEHALLWRMLDRPGNLTYTTKFDLWNLLRPALQPGSKLDHPLPVEKALLRFESSVPFGELIVSGSSSPKSGKSPQGHYWNTIATTVDEGTEFRLQWRGQTKSGVRHFRVSFATNEDDRARALPLRRVFAPWVAFRAAKIDPIANRELPQLKGGDWAKGKAIFFSDRAQCSRCHQVGGEGGKQGPDLSNLIHRDYDSVLRDIRQPSASLNPDYLTYAVELFDGRTFIGTLRSEGKKLWLGTSDGKELELAQSAVESLRPGTNSTMPEGLDKNLNAAELRDLMMFLLTEARPK